MLNCNLSRRVRALAFGIVGAVLSASFASAATLPLSADLTINATVGNEVTSTQFPLTASLTSIGSGEEFSFSNGNLITFLSSGFPQTMSGSIGVDISDGQIVLRYSGTAQGVNLTYELSNLDFGTPAMVIDSASQSASTGIIGGVNQTNDVAFSDTSIKGGFTFFGFQPDTSVTQTIGFTTKAAPVTMAPVPLPASMPLIIVGLGALGAMAHRKKARS